MRGSPAVALAVVLLGPLLRADFTYDRPAQRHGDAEATLSVHVADTTAVQGHGDVTLTMTVTGPAGLEVEGPQLSDATTTWKEERRPYSRTVAEGRATWVQVIRLRQVKPGVEAPPDVSLRFRDGPEQEWGEARWVDILKQMRDGPSPPVPPQEPSALRRWGPVLAGVAAVGLLLLIAWALRRRRGAAPPLSPEQWAVREIERVEHDLLPPRGDAEAFHTQLSLVVRRYLAQRCGLPALEQTTAELFEALHRMPDVPAQRQALLRELFERCDLAKFARAGAAADECRRSAELARQMVQQTARPAGR